MQCRPWGRISQELTSKVGVLVFYRVVDKKSGEDGRERVSVWTVQQEREKPGAVTRAKSLLSERLQIERGRVGTCC